MKFVVMEWTAIHNSPSKYGGEWCLSGVGLTSKPRPNMTDAIPSARIFVDAVNQIAYRTYSN